MLKALSLLTALTLAGAMLCPITAFSAEKEMTPEEKKRIEDISAEEMMVDLILLRPAGVLATALGATFFVVSYPLNYFTGKTKPAYEKLIISPVNYTFKRDLGDF